MMVQIPPLPAIAPAPPPLHLQGQAAALHLLNGGGMGAILHFPGGLGQHLQGLGMAHVQAAGPFDPFEDSDDEDMPLVPVAMVQPPNLQNPNPNPGPPAAVAVMPPRGIYGLDGCRSLATISLRCDEMRAIEWSNLPALNHLDLDCPSLVRPLSD